MKNQIAGLMQQAQRMQEGMKRLQEELENVEVEGQAGSGLVKVTMTCKYRMRRVQIAPTLLGDDRDMLEDLIVAATNDAVRLAEAASQQRMQSITAGMPLPPGFRLPGF
jgi:DNA-binding YbaB/EbfC family protein